MADQSKVQEALKILDSLTPEEWAEVFSKRCKYCGASTEKSRCWCNRDD